MRNNKGEEVGIIYGWYCTVTDKWYIGQTVNPEKRFKTHIYDAIDTNDNNYFHRALRKYGLENFVYCVLEDNVLRDNLNMKEQEWIEYYDSFPNGYNETAGGGQTIFSVEMKKKMSESHKGKHFSEEHRKNLSNSRKGKHLSDETKKKLSNTLKSKTPWNVGQRLSNEHKKKLSESCKGNIPPNIRKVSQYDLNGNFIKTYNSVTDAMKDNPKTGHLTDVCKGYRKQAGGFIWKYA